MRTLKINCVAATVHNTPFLTVTIQIINWNEQYY